MNALRRPKGNCVRGNEMGARFEGTALALLLVDAQSGSSVAGQAQICPGDCREQGATMHFSKVRFSAIQRTVSEREGCSQVANNRRQIDSYRQNVSRHSKHRLQQDLYSSFSRKTTLCFLLCVWLLMREPWCIDGCTYLHEWRILVCVWTAQRSSSSCHRHQAT